MKTTIFADVMLCFASSMALPISTQQVYENGATSLVDGVIAPVNGIASDIGDLTKAVPAAASKLPPCLVSLFSDNDTDFL
jgi:hypothetical protein